MANEFILNRLLYLLVISFFSFLNLKGAEWGSYDVKFYFLDLSVSNEDTRVYGSVSIGIELTEKNTDTLMFELTKNATVDSVYLNGIPLSYIRREDQILISLADTTVAGDFLMIKFFYNHTDNEEPDNRGISKGKLSNGKPVVWSLSEPFYASKWFPCKQDLNDKADSAWLFFTTNKNLNVGSVGKLTTTVPLENERVRYEWKTFYPVAYYLISFAVADYIDYSFLARVDDADSVVVKNYIPDDSTYFHTQKDKIDATADLIETYSVAFGPYPFADEKYGHCVAPLGGGMEHQTMTTIDNFDFELVAHELAHQWFGDYVTCSNWQDIWINEGFASYAELIALERLRPQEVNDWLQDTYSRIIEEQGGSVYIPKADSANDDRIFDFRLSYRKGAFLLHMIRNELNNDSIFFSVLKTFVNRYGNSNAGADDFRQTLEEITNRNFVGFFNQWYYGEGHPLFFLKWQQANDTLKIKLTQQGSMSLVTPFFDVFVELKISFLEGDTIIRVHQSVPELDLSLPFKKRIYNLTIDPENKILKEILSTERILNNDSVFTLFPNPASDIVYIENLKTGLPFKVRIYDQLGKLISEYESSEPFLQISLDTFTKGVYQVVVSRKNHNEIFQLSRI